MAFFADSDLDLIIFCLPALMSPLLPPSYVLLPSPKAFMPPLYVLLTQEKHCRWILDAGIQGLLLFSMSKMPNNVLLDYISYDWY